VALKPVSCPCHLEIVRRRSLSHRDLPLRIAEFGLVHRREPGGSLHGLFRLRQFTQDDGHIFCLPEQIDAEVLRFARGLKGFYAGFGFELVDVRLSTRPPSRAGDDDLWTRAESMLGDAASAAGLAWSEQPGAGAFYGPKLEFNLQDSLGRVWQCGTIQLDLVLPARFGVSYDAAYGSRQVPMMLHRALYGSLERFMGMLLEQTGGRLAPWLAPEQVRVVPVGAGHIAAASSFVEELGLLRAGVDDSCDETLSLRVFRAHQDGVPFVVILGDREVSAGTVTIRSRGSQNQVLTRPEALGFLTAACRP
jgi:threonyl-tRNA synthetase